MTAPSFLRCEIAVIGSGPGGAIAASLLAEAGKDVIILEEGPFLQLESCLPFSTEEMIQKYRSGGLTPAFGRTKIAYVEGRCVGGGSEINSALYHRTPAEVLERWRNEYEVAALTPRDLDPHFHACEREIGVGPSAERIPQASTLLHEGATRLGWSSVEVPRCFRYEAGKKGIRQSMTKTYVPRALAAGAKLRPGTRAMRLVRDGSGWSVRAETMDQDGISRPLEVRAETVFLACGAIQTPALLRRSGISENIGNQLQIHPTVKLLARYGREINPPVAEVPMHQVKEFAPRFTFGCSISSPGFLGVEMATSHPEFVREVRTDWSRMTIFYAMIIPEGTGRVRNIPGCRDPLVRYGLTSGDRRTLSEGLGSLARLALESGAEAVYPGFRSRGRERGWKITRQSELKEFPAELPEALTPVMTIHLFSSCPMGENRKKCAADSFGRVHGQENLRIVDASLLCSAPGVNPQGSIMAVSRRNTLQFLGRI